MTTRRSRSPFVATILLLTAFACAAARAAAGDDISAEWRTPAELAAFEATPPLAETIGFLERLAARFPALRLERFGNSAAGRPMTVAILSADRSFTPEAAAASGKPVLLVWSGIHAGEIDGKDATLMLLRDLALGRHPELLSAATVLFVPVYNVDGHERMSPWNRPNQDGPHQGMGFRTTVDGHDLNRDFLKVETPEARALVGLFNAWRPHLMVDVHVTDGSDFDWVLTWAAPEAPQLAAPLDNWMKAHLPAALAATAAAGHKTGPYVDLLDGSDPAKGFSSFNAEPRYSTGYFPLRQRPSILVEMHSYKPYRDRVLAVRDFLAALLAEVGRGAGDLRGAVAAAERAEIESGRPGATASTMSLAFDESEASDRILFPIYDWRLEPSLVSGRPIVRYQRGQVRALEVPWRHRARIAARASRPRGYLVQAGWPAIEERLAVHGLRVSRTTAPVEIEVEVARLGEPKAAERPYQGLTRVTAAASWTRERRTIPAGTLWIPADQPDFEVAVQLLEPEAPDSLLAWGMLSLVFELKEWIGGAVLEDEARRQIADPAVAAAWEAALADPAFAASREKRWLWWFQRTRWFDAEYRVLPVFRVPQALPADAVAPATTVR